jgi:hypothetical protein
MSMTTAQWRKLMQAWSAAIRETSLVKELAEKDRSLDFLGFPPASDKQIEAAEHRLGIRLPPSYKNFLKATNGFRVLNSFIQCLRPAAEIDWFRVENKGWAKTWNEPTIYDDPDRPPLSDEEYFDYKHVAEFELRTEHLIHMLQISEVGDGVMLLNPCAVTPDGEWEAWFFANWIPGARRYASFAHMMVETYRQMRKIEKLPKASDLPKVKVPGPKAPRHSLIPAAPAPDKPKPQSA